MKFTLKCQIHPLREGLPFDRDVTRFLKSLRPEYWTYHEPLSHNIHPQNDSQFGELRFRKDGDGYGSNSIFFRMAQNGRGYGSDFHIAETSHRGSWTGNGVGIGQGYYGNIHGGGYGTERQRRIYNT